MIHTDHPVGTRRDPSPLPFGFVRATEYSEFLRQEEVTRRLRAISPTTRTAMALAAPGVEPLPYPLVAASPFAKNEAPMDDSTTERLNKFAVGRAGVPAAPVAEQAEEVNAMSAPRTSTDTWVDYALSPKVTGTARVESAPASPFKSKPTSSFYDMGTVPPGNRRMSVGNWQILMTVAILAVVVGIALIALH